jgi:predicted Rossmann fold nucleotide-binding protein DprA/Smf involved in DNA uptake
VLDALVGPGVPRRSLPTASGPRLEPELAGLLELVERGAATADSLARASRLQPGPLSTALLSLELSGYVRCNAEGRYERTSLAAPDPA